MISAALALFVSSAGAEQEFVLGVGTHLQRGKSGLLESLDRLEEAGITALRDDASWASVEIVREELNIPSGWDKIIQEANARHIAPLLVLDYGNRWYDDGGKPMSPEAIAGFSRYARTLVEHFKGQVPRYEIWNEWDHSAGRTTSGSADAYVRLAKSVFSEIKAVDPDAEVLVGAVTPRGIRRGFVARIIKQGILDYGDALSLHTYLHCKKDPNPEAWAVWMRKVKQELDQLAGRSMDFYITEMGWPAHRGKCGVSPETQAQYLARMLLLARTMPFIKGVWWYDLQNDGPDAAEREHNFGLLDYEMKPKPAYEALRLVSTVAAKGQYIARLDSEKTGVHAHAFRLDGSTILAAWREENTQCTTLRLTAPKPFPATLQRTANGFESMEWKQQPNRATEAHARDGVWLDLPLSAMPFLLHLDEPKISMDSLEVSCLEVD